MSKSKIIAGYVIQLKVEKFLKDPVPDLGFHENEERYDQPMVCVAPDWGVGKNATRIPISAEMLSDLKMWDQVVLQVTGDECFLPCNPEVPSGTTWKPGAEVVMLTTPLRVPPALAPLLKNWPGRMAVSNYCKKISVVDAPEDIDAVVVKGFCHVLVARNFEMRSEVPHPSATPQEKEKWANDLAAEVQRHCPRRGTYLDLPKSVLVTKILHAIQGKE